VCHYIVDKTTRWFNDSYLKTGEGEKRGKFVALEVGNLT
jgi:hypothetical protein